MNASARYNERCWDCILPGLGGWWRVLPLCILSLMAMLLNPIAVHADEATGSFVRSGCEIDYPPFCIVHDDGRADGFSVELMRAALQKMGREITYRTGTWTEVRGWLESGEVDALPLVGRTPEREAIFDFTVPYMTMRGAIVVRKETEDVHTLADLRERRVAVMEGDNAEEFLRREDRSLEILTMPTFSEAFHALAEGHCDAVVVQRLVALRLLEETGLTNLKIVDRPIQEFSQDFCFAVKKGDSELLSILNEGLALAVADGTHRRLHTKWFAMFELPAARPIVVGGDHNFPPFEFLDDKGRPAGFTVELTQAIARELNMDVHIKLGSWADIVEGLKQGEIDVVQGIYYTTERSRTLDFSSQYLASHYVGVTRADDGAPLETLAALTGRSVAVQSGDAILEALAQQAPNALIVMVETQEDVLRSVMDGKTDCGVAVRLSALYFISENSWSGLHLGKQSLFTGEYSYAVQQGNDALLAQFTEGLQILKGTDEYQQIYERWLGVYEVDLSPLAVMMYITIIVVPLLLIVTLALLWSWSLKQQVRARTRELQESLDRFQSVFEAANTGKSITQLSGELSVNQAFADMLGYSRAELQGRTWQELTTPEDIPVIEQHIKPLLDGKEDSVRYEKRYPYKNGGIVWADVSVTLLRDSHNQPLYFITTVVDITERKRVDEALRESEWFLKSTLDGLSAHIAVVDEHGVIVLTNKAYRDFAEQNGTEPGAVSEGANYLAVCDTAQGEYSEEATSFGEGIRAVLAGNRQSFDLEYPCHSPEEQRWFFVRVTPFKGKGPRRVVIAHEVITERKHAEEAREKLQVQLIQAQKMESVGRLAGGVAHDFNNILQTMMGYSQMLLDALPSESDEHEFAFEIYTGTEKAAALTRQLLAFARKQTISPKVLDLNDAIESMLKMLRRLIGEDIDIAWLPAGGLWRVKMDPGQVDQILANLCVNARDAIGGVGKVTIETENFTFDEAYCTTHAGFVPGEFVMLAVSDDGCGIDKEIRTNIFEPIFTTKGLGEGTGLGLATIYGIVKQNEGFINVYTESGKGTTFRIYFTRHAAEAALEERVSRVETYNGHGETVLFVEDDASILPLGELMLEGMGYDVKAFGSPREALEFVKKNECSIQLLITDVVMPEMSGRELADAMRGVCPEIRVLFMSGYTANVIAHRGVLDEGVNFIQKPFSSHDLARKVYEALNS